MVYPLIDIASLSRDYDQKIVRLRGRVFSKKYFGRILFLVLRDGLHTLQAVVTKAPECDDASQHVSLYDALRKVENESFIELTGKVCIAHKMVISCSQKYIELEVIDFVLISRSVLDLPITLKEATLPESQKVENMHTLPSVQFYKRLDHRVLDLRSDLNQAIFRINDGLMHGMQSYLRKHGFIEIKTPKIIGGSSEGGSNVFTLDYFGKQACLAQSPQLYKQMCIMGDLRRVFEIGPVFRAENSNTTRHLTEFVGIDLEMVIDHHFMEIVHFIYGALVGIFDTLYEQYAAEFEVVSHFYKVPKLLMPKELVVIPFTEAVSLLKQGDLEDFSTEQEKMLGSVVREKYATDLYVVTHYPCSVRPFYTMADPENHQYSCSFDFMLRGTEVLSGAQRIHDYQALCDNIKRFGLDKDKMAYYVESFKYGAPAHGGVGMGLERLLRCLLGLPDVRYCSLFPRDPKRLYP